ncbi:DUF6517 family protein [Halopenitus salinus]|uniref:DUF6517 family protein n=1 Tax=Halopenitus salinus TaxID=1198295 RepID=A0ABD5UYG0_9EURY
MSDRHDSSIDREDASTDREGASVDPDDASADRDDARIDSDRRSNRSGGTSRRRFLLAGGAVGMAGLAGCTTFDVARGEVVEFEAGTATVADAALSETDYELNDVTTETRTHEVDVPGGTRTVRVKNRVAEYDKAVDLFGERYQAAVFVTLATPRVELLGRSYNPIADMDNAELAEVVLSRYDDASDPERGSEYTTSILGTDATVVVYTAQGNVQGTDISIDLELHVADPVGTGGDFVVPVAAYPDSFGDGENVRRMMNAIEHANE